MAVASVELVQLGRLCWCGWTATAAREQHLQARQLLQERRQSVLEADGVVVVAVVVAAVGTGGQRLERAVSDTVTEVAAAGVDGQTGWTDRVGRQTEWAASADPCRSVQARESILAVLGMWPGSEILAQSPLCGCRDQRRCGGCCRGSGCTGGRPAQGPWAARHRHRHSDHRWSVPAAHTLRAAGIVAFNCNKTLAAMAATVSATAEAAAARPARPGCGGRPAKFAASHVVQVALGACTASQLSHLLLPTGTPRTHTHTHTLKDCQPASQLKTSQSELQTCVSECSVGLTRLHHASHTRTHTGDFGLPRHKGIGVSSLDLLQSAACQHWLTLATV
ncbi:hypothetical protein BC831DRAFT_232812 [Entophlyctis helioformis]|nr:hypothetical protein BC831DRAFT_232812 [Entophlyctis helioformis]